MQHHFRVTVVGEKAASCWIFSFNICQCAVSEQFTFLNIHTKVAFHDIAAWWRIDPNKDLVPETGSELIHVEAVLATGGQEVQQTQERFG